MMTGIFVLLAFYFWLFALWGFAHKRPIIFSRSWLITAAPIGALLFFIWLFASESISHSFTEVLQLIALLLLVIASFTFKVWRLSRGYFIIGVTDNYLLRALSSAACNFNPPLTAPLPWLLITQPRYGSCRLILRDRQYKSEFQQLVRAIDAYFIEMPDEVNNTPYVFHVVIGFVMLICAFVFLN
jgi:hypothetical protein